MTLFNKYIKIHLVFILFPLLLSCGSPEIHVEIDDRLIPFPFYGEVTEIDNQDFLIFYSQYPAGIIVYDLKNKTIQNDILYENYYLKNGHFQTFALSVEDKLYMLPKGINDIIEFDINGIKKNHYWFKKRKFNHFSNYRNHPIVFANEIYQTSIDSLKNKNNRNLIERVTHIKNKSYREIEIPIPGKSKNLPLANIFPSKIKVQESILYNFPNDASFFIYDLKKHSTRNQEILLTNQLKTSSEQNTTNYLDEIEYYRNSDLIRKVIYNHNSNKYLLVIKRIGFENFSIVNLNKDFSQEGPEEKLSTSCYWESIISYKEGFIAIDQAESQEIKGFIFKDVKTFTL